MTVEELISFLETIDPKKQVMAMGENSLELAIVVDMDDDYIIIVSESDVEKWESEYENS